MSVSKREWVQRRKSKLNSKYCSFKIRKCLLQENKSLRTELSELSPNPNVCFVNKTDITFMFETDGFEVKTIASLIFRGNYAPFANNLEYKNNLKDLPKDTDLKV